MAKDLVMVAVLGLGGIIVVVVGPANEGVEPRSCFPCVVQALAEHYFLIKARLREAPPKHCQLPTKFPQQPRRQRNARPDETTNLHTRGLSDPQHFCSLVLHVPACVILPSGSTQQPRQPPTVKSPNLSGFKSVPCLSCPPRTALRGRCPPPPGSVLEHHVGPPR